VAPADTAARFVQAVNALAVEELEPLLAPDFQFTAGPHTSSREDFLASAKASAAADPYLHFTVHQVAGDGDTLRLVGEQAYLWREDDTVASNDRSELVLELRGEQVARATLRSLGR
jgi:hypothetical protein